MIIQTIATMLLNLLFKGEKITEEQLVEKLAAKPNHSTHSEELDEIAQAPEVYYSDNDFWNWVDDEVNQINGLLKK